MGKKKQRLWPSIDEVLPGPLMDNHTHLPVKPGDYVQDSASVRLGLEEQMGFAGQVGLTQVVASICDVPEIVSWSEQLERWHSPDLSLLRWAVAIHPNEAANHAGIFDMAPDGVRQSPKEHHSVPLDQAFAQVEQVARSNRDLVVAIGESGLDYFRTSLGGKDSQKQSFRDHIALAKDLDLPLQIHDRNAHEDCVQILLSDGAPHRTVFHCFSGDEDLAQVFNENGWYASFAGNVTYPANTDLQAGARAIDSSLLLVETDAPYLTAVPWRGHPNASYVITHTLRFLSQLLDFSASELCQIINGNSQRVYGSW